MRRTLLTLTLLLLTGTAWAAEPAANTNPVFGGGVCGKPFSCVALSSSTSSIIATANSCSSLLFGMADNAFDAGSKLDSSNCITSKAAPKATTGFTMSVKCCVAPINSSNNCQLTCTRYGLR